MTRYAAAMALIGIAALAGCDALDPYPTTPHAAPPGAVPGQRVAICYNTLTTTLAEVKAAAQQECSAGTIAEPDDTDWHLQNCPVLLPAHATFTCVTKQ